MLEELEMSLSERLHQAALERARESGHRVDEFVLEPTGVIDLREMERQPAPTVDNTVVLPALESDAVIDALYAKPLSATRLWKRVRGTMAPGDLIGAEPHEPAAVESRPEAVMIDLTEEVPLIDIEAPTSTARCQRCGASSQRDLVDLFNRVAYLSCDDCGHMWQQKAD